jgi:hypothetical protein
MPDVSETELSVSDAVELFQWDANSQRFPRVFPGETLSVNVLAQIFAGKVERQPFARFFRVPRQHSGGTCRCRTSSTEIEA